MNLKIDLEALKNDDGYFSENDVKAVEHLTGKSFSDVLQDAKKASQPAGSPAQWDTKTKLKFIEEYGRDAYQRALKNG